MRNGNWKKFCLVFIAFFAIVIFCSCSCNNKDPETEISVTSLVLSTDPKDGVLNVKKNSTFTIRYSTTPTNAKVPGVYVDSSNDHCVMVLDEHKTEAEGEIRFRATGTGKSTITVMSKDGGLKKQCQVTVYEPTALETPTNIVFDGIKLMWSETTKDVNGAARLCDEKYEITISSDSSSSSFTVEDNYFASSTLFTFEKEKLYSVSVKALGDDDVRNSNSASSSVYKFYILDTPKYSVENGDVRWSFVKSETSENNPNYFKIQYNDAGDYVLVANHEGKNSRNVYLFSENLKELYDFNVSIQAIKVPANTSEEEVRSLIDSASENNTIIHAINNKIDYIASKPSSTFALHRTVPIENVSINNSGVETLTIGNMSFDGAYASSVLKFSGEGEYFKNKVRYSLKFKNNSNGNEVTIGLPVGVTEYVFGENFRKDVISAIGEKLQTPDGSISYNLTNYTVKIYPSFADPAVDKANIIIGESSSEYNFTYFNAPASLLNINIDTANAVLNYENPLHNSSLYFESLQFVFASPETGSYKLVEPQTNSIDLKEALQGLQGVYQIWINLKGLDATGTSLGTINKLGVKYENSGGEAEVIETIAAPTGLNLSNNGTISWNRVDGAKEYRLELKINDSTTYVAIITDGEGGNVYSLETLLSENGTTYNDLEAGLDYEIRVISVAAKENVIDSASDSLIFKKLNQVKNLVYRNGVVSWEGISGISKYLVSVNNGNSVSVSKTATSVDIYSQPTLYKAIYNDFAIENVISIWAVGDSNSGTTDSLPATIKVSKNPTPIITKVEDNKLYWESSGVKGDKYKVIIAPFSNQQNKIEHSEIVNNYFDLTNIEFTEKIIIWVQRYSEVTFNSSESKAFYLKRLAISDFKIIEKNNEFYLSWSAVDGAEGYQISGLINDVIKLNKIDENSYLNKDAGTWEYKLTGLDETKKYNISITAITAKEYLVGSNSSVNVALVASKNKNLTVAKLPKVSYSVEEDSVRWGFTNWALYDEYSTKLSEFKYALTVTNSKGDIVSSLNNLSTNENELMFNHFDADTYNIAIQLKGSVENNYSNDYVVYSDLSDLEVTKLNTVELGIKDGKLVFDRTIEGIKNTSSEQKCDYYSIFANGELLTPADYSITEDKENAQMIVTLTSLIGSETSYSVVVRRTSTLSGDKYFINSNESTKLKAQNINIVGFEKVGPNLEFIPAVVVNGKDVANRYIINGKHSKDSGYSYYQEIISGDESYFKDGKYIVPLGSLSVGAGEYIYNITVVGQEILDEENNSKVAYLGDSEGQTISVIVLNDPLENQVIVEDGVIKLNKYVGASDNKKDVPYTVVVTFEKFNTEKQLFETYGTPIELNYSSIEFKSGKYTLDLAEDYLEAGEYKIYAQFIGDENLVVSSNKIQGNNGQTVAKVSDTITFVYGGKLSWQEVSGASYRLYFDGEETYTELTTSSQGVAVENNIVSLDTSSWSAGKKTIKIQVVKDGALPSNISDEFTVFKLNTMKIEANNDNGVKVISWAEVLEGATNQEIYYDGEKIDSIGISNASWVITPGYEVGNHSFTMISIGSVDTRVGGNLVGYLTSDESNSVTINFIEPTVKVNFNKGIAEWQEVKGILTYEVSLYKASNYPDVKELVSAGTSTTTNKTSFDLNDFGVLSGSYVLEVKVASIDPLSAIITSTHTEVEDNYFKVIKIDKFGDNAIYSNQRVENGKFALDISAEYLSNYISLLKNTNPSEEAVAVYETITLENVVQVINKEADANITQILYGLINFNILLNEVVLPDQVPSGYKLMLDEGYLTLYYDITTEANQYEIQFAPIGNTCTYDNEVVIGVLNGEFIESVVAVKPDEPVCPVFAGSENSIVAGILVWAAPTGFDKNYILELKNAKTNEIMTKEIVVADEKSDSNVWQAVQVDSTIQLDLNSAVEAGELIQGVEYVIAIYTKGTVNSKEISVDEVKYLTGVKNVIQKTFIALEAPKTFRSSSGEIYWSKVDSAIGYELYLYGYNESTSSYDIEIAEHQCLYFEADKNLYSVIDNANIPAGRYMVGIKAKGDGNYKIDSPMSFTYLVKLGTVEAYVSEGYFVFEEINYNTINASGELTGASNTVANYVFRIKERNSATGDVEHNFLTEKALTKKGNKYYYELPDELKDSLSDYKFEVYAKGDSSYLLSGDTLATKYFFKSEIVSDFTIDEKGIVSWSDIEDYYAVYVRPSGGTLTRIDFGGVDYTENNYFDINSYANNNNKFGVYEIYIKSLHNNETDIEKQESGNTRLISSKSITVKVNVISSPRIKLNSGNILWQSALFESVKEEITSSYLVIKGKILVNGVKTTNDQIIKVKCSNTEPMFINDYYTAEFISASNESYYLIDIENPIKSTTIISLAGGEKYNIEVNYIGHIGKLDNSQTYLCSSSRSVSVSDVECLLIPTDLSTANASNIDNPRFNHIKWKSVQNASGYEAVVYSADESNRLEEYAIYNSIDNSDMFTIESDYTYFNIDTIIKEFAVTEYWDKSISIKVKAIGSTWESSGNKCISSNYSKYINIKYPLAPTNVRYNGSGLITWQNNSSGDVYIQVEYILNTTFYSSDTDAYKTSGEGLNYTEIVKREVTGLAVYTVVDTIKLSVTEGSAGVYQLKYLTEKINSIKLWVEAGGFVSAETVYTSQGEDASLSEKTQKFMLFNGGDGSVNNPFKIIDETGLKNISHYLDSHFVITKNITLNNSIVPIGSKSTTVNTAYKGAPKAFNGTLTGNVNGFNATITNVTLIADESYYFGLFYGVSENGKISKLDVQFANNESNNIVAKNNTSYIGGIVANENRGTIENVNTSGKIYVTGINNSLSYSVYLSGIATFNYGTIVGSSTGSYMNTSLVVTTNTCSYIGSVSYYNYGTIKNYGVKDVTLKGSSVGGIATINAGTISDSFVKATININGGNFNNIATLTAGGIAGQSTNSIARCYSVINITVENISTTNGCYIGALVGDCVSGSIDSVYVSMSGTSTNATVGKVYGKYSQGNASGIIYYNEENLGSNISGYGTGTGSENAVTSSSSLGVIVGELNINKTAFTLNTEGTAIKLLWEN